MSKSLNYRAPERKAMVPARSESPFPGIKKAESPITQKMGGTNLAPFGTDIMPKNWGKATPAQANKLHELTKHVGRAKASGTSRGPRPS